MYNFFFNKTELITEMLHNTAETSLLIAGFVTYNYLPF